MKKNLLTEGISDAIGFVDGALLGLDVFSPGYGSASIAGIVLVGMAGDCRASRKQPKE